MSDLGNYDAQTELFQALRNDKELAALTIGGFHNLVAESDAEFPRVVYSEIDNTPSAHADNEESKVTVNFQVSIFTDGQANDKETPMTKAIDRIMKSLKYKKYDSQSLYETDTKLYHKALRYEKNFYGGNK